jgi:hypothetical protein
MTIVRCHPWPWPTSDIIEISLEAEARRAKMLTKDEARRIAVKHAAA